MDIRVVEKSAYGNQLLYPVNEAARTLATLTGRKTLKLGDLLIARKLGHTISVEYAQESVRKEVEAINATAVAEETL